MKIETSKGGEFEADLVFEIGADHSLMIRLTEDERPLSQVAADFEGIEWLATEDGRSYDAYTDLRSLVRFGENELQLRLFRKEG